MILLCAVISSASLFFQVVQSGCHWHVLLLLANIHNVFWLIQLRLLYSAFGDFARSFYPDQFIYVMILMSR